MGNDGGTIAKRQDILSLHSLITNKSLQKVSDDNEAVSLVTCNISHMSLYDRPVVGDYKGKLYLKEKMLEHLIQRRISKDAGLWDHIRSTKDLVDVKITWKLIDGVPTFECPISRKLKLHNMTYVYLLPCGCVMSFNAIEDLSNFQLRTAKRDKKNIPDGNESSNGLETGTNGKSDKSTEKSDKSIEKSVKPDKSKEKSTDATNDESTNLPCPLCGVGFHKSDIVIINPLNNAKHAEYNEKNFQFISETLQLTHSKQPKKVKKRLHKEKEGEKRKRIKE